MRDKIYVSDYKKTIEIGAFQEERLIKQDIVFHVVIELNPQRTELDIVDDILSYDVIVDAINDTISAKRYNLLETMAEDIAERIMNHPQAALVSISVEKMGRIDGKLGIKIVRDQNSSKDGGRHIANDINAIAINPITYTNKTFEGVSIVIPINMEFPQADETSRRIYALKSDALAWELAQKLNLPVVDTKVEALSLISRNMPFIRALGKQPFDQIPTLDDYSKDGLMKWHKEQLALSNIQDLTEVE